LQDSVFLEALGWLQANDSRIDWHSLSARLNKWKSKNPYEIGDVIYLLHSLAPDAVLRARALDDEIYTSPGPKFRGRERYITQAEVAILALSTRWLGMPSIDAAFLQILRTISKARRVGSQARRNIAQFLANNRHQLPNDSAIWPEVAILLRQLITRLGYSTVKVTAGQKPESRTKAINVWADALEQAIAERAKQKPASKSKATKTTKRTSKKSSPRRKR